MGFDSPRIAAVKARQTAVAGRICIETTVITEEGCSGENTVTAGLSVGNHEPDFQYDGGKRYRGKGVLKATQSINKIIAPSIKGLDVTDQSRIDQTMTNLDVTGQKIGIHSIASVSGAVAKAAARSLRIPLYQYIDGTERKVHILPVPTFHVPV